MVDIFSSFDPANNLIYSISPLIIWINIFLILILVTPQLWITPNHYSNIMASFILIIIDQADRTNIKAIKTFPLILASLFFLLIIINLSGTIPYFFAFSSHLLFSLTLGLPLWLIIIISALSFNSLYVFASLLPAGAPLWLNPFLILVETLRILVRPVTLCFRLTANISAGHVVITLVGTYLASALLNLSISSILILIIIQSGYIIFEFGVAIIQAYIFCLLLSLYRNDHPS